MTIGCRRAPARVTPYPFHQTGGHGGNGRFITDERCIPCDDHHRATGYQEEGGGATCRELPEHPRGVDRRALLVLALTPCSPHWAPPGHRRHFGVERWPRRS